MNLVKIGNGSDNNGHDTPKGSVQTMESFNQMINEEPPAEEVQVNKASGNSKYLPIGIGIMLLDKHFMCLWETKDFRYTVVANEMIGAVKLRVFHPVARIWIEREGAAAVMIQQKANSDITDISAKIKNTLGKDHPHLLASCIMSAAKTLGKRYGRDLNRKYEDSYESFYTNIAASEEVTSAIDWTLVKTMQDLLNIWEANAPLHKNKNFQKAFTYQKNKLAK